MAASYLVTYRKARSTEEGTIELSSKKRLLEWIEENGSRCWWVHILRVEDPFA